MVSLPTPFLRGLHTIRFRPQDPASRAGHGTCISKDARRNWKYRNTKVSPCRETGVQVCKAG